MLDDDKKWVTEQLQKLPTPAIRQKKKANPDGRNELTAKYSRINMNA